MNLRETLEWMEKEDMDIDRVMDDYIQFKLAKEKKRCKEVKSK